jgi:hypothetical protein
MQPVKFESASSQSEPSPTCMVRVMLVHLDCSRNVAHNVNSLAHLQKGAINFLGSSLFYKVFLTVCYQIRFIPWQMCIMCEKFSLFLGRLNRVYSWNSCLQFGRRRF